MTRSAFFSPPLPRVFAHRGFAEGDVVENTIPAFAAALALGATHLETDVHCSKDGIAVIAHDPDLLRVAGVPGDVRSFTAAELAALDLGGVGVPTLAEVLAAFPDARFNIDIKSREAAGPAAKAIRAAGAEQRVLLTSFARSRRVAALRLVPGAATSPSALTLAGILLAARVGFLPLVRMLGRRLDALQAPERALGIRFSHPRVLRSVHAAGLEVHIWTVDDLPTMAALLDAGVDGIITNRSDLAVGLVADRAL